MATRVTISPRRLQVKKIVIATLLRLLTNIERVIDNLKKNLSKAFGFQVGSIGFVEPGHDLKRRQH